MCVPDPFVDSKPFRDFTIPYFSFIGCRKFDDTLKKLYGETMIEDLWLNYFCISTNLTTAKPVCARSSATAKGRSGEHLPSRRRGACYSRQ